MTFRDETAASRELETRTARRLDREKQAEAAFARNGFLLLVVSFVKVVPVVGGLT
ncbi:hypothetical protein ACIHFD_03860 [Nonomuraea sp. NPDC051941]|uniref:hypothetical protein n=1 Tax=Nonomuraea sp. NPDC051941 TaxID=3364373 RepID=UPI0037C68C02